MQLKTIQAIEAASLELDEAKTRLHLRIVDALADGHSYHRCGIYANLSARTVLTIWQLTAEQVDRDARQQQLRSRLF